MVMFREEENSNYQISEILLYFPSGVYTSLSEEEA